MKINLIQGDCIEKLKELDDNSVDSIVTDPPAGIAFMGKEWDHDKGGRDSWIEWKQEVATECKRVLKPGGHAFVWAIPRTSHWTATAWENAGFEIRDVVAHVFGSGFPKSHNIGKSIDKLQGNERETIRIRTDGNKGGGANTYDDDNYVWDKPFTETKGTSEWEGWGTALKPAREDWLLMRKPLGYWEIENTLTQKEKNEFQDLWDRMEAGMPYDEKRYKDLWAKKEVKVFKGLTIAENCLKHGVGGINIDESRVEAQGRDLDKLNSEWDREWNTNYSDYADKVGGSAGFNMDKAKKENAGLTGRFPANLITDGSEEVRECFPDSKGDSLTRKPRVKYATSQFGFGNGNDEGIQTGGKTDSGNASRFFKSIPQGRFPANLITDGSDEVKECFPETGKAGNIRETDGITAGNSIFGIGDLGKRNPKINGDNGGNASRFFKSIATDLHCSLCYDTIEPYQSTKKVCQNNANNAETLLSQENTQKAEGKTTNSNSAPEPALEKLLPNSEGNKSHKNNNVFNAEKNFTNMQATTESTAPQNATTPDNKKFVQNVRYAGNLCEVCGTYIAHVLVGVKAVHQEGEARGRIFITEHKKQILNSVLASFVELRGKKDTTPTMNDLSLLFGFVLSAIENSTTYLGQEKEQGKSHEWKSLLYQSKPSKAERNRGCDGLYLLKDNTPKEDIEEIKHLLSI